MTRKTQIIIVIATFTLGLGTGLYIKRQPAVTQATRSKKEQDKVTDKKTTIVKDPTGKEVTTITEETRIKTTQDSQSKSQTTVKAKPQAQVSALAGIDIHSGIPTYGVAASKELLGPITLGAFGLTNGTVGVSVGMTF